MVITRRNFVKKSGIALSSIESVRNFQEFSDQPFTKKGTIDRIETNAQGEAMIVILVPNYREKQFIVKPEKLNFCPREGVKVNVTYQKKAPSQETKVLKVEKL